MAKLLPPALILSYGKQVPWIDRQTASTDCTWLSEANVERSADWMDQARGDLAHARNDLEDGFCDWACFSAQQAADKAVKAVLHRAGGEAWGHSVADLLGEVRRSQPVAEDLLDAALELDKAYIPALYPDAHPSGSPRRRYTRTEAARMVTHAERIVGFSEGLLS